MVEEQSVLPNIGIVTRKPASWQGLLDTLREHHYPTHLFAPQELFVCLDEQYPDLLLFDARDADPPAVETCRLIRSNKRWQAIDVLALSLPEERDALYQAGCTVVLTEQDLNGPTLWRVLERMLLLRVREDELAHSEEASSQQSDVLQEQRKQYALFVGTLSHEVRTPLGVIEGFVINLLDGLEGDLSELQRQSLTIIHKNIYRLKQYLGDILDHSKLEVDTAKNSSRLRSRQAPRRVFRRRLLPMSEVVDEVVELFQEKFQRKDVALTIVIDDNLPRLWMDRSKIRQVLVNLLSNACKFTPSHGDVTVRIEALSSEKKILTEEGSDGTARRLAYLQVSVEDTGVGIAADDLSSLFSQFVRAEGAELQVDGSGLGLSICKQIVEEHGGEISVESVVQEGTTIRFFLPIDLRRRRLGKMFVFSEQQQLLQWVREYRDNLEEIERLSSPEEIKDMLSRGCLDLLLFDSPDVSALLRELE